LSWLFIGGLCIIWAAFLLPVGSRRASPATTVEDFERKMDLLAETNRAPAGRWVLVPRKGERFLGARDRKRMRVRRRRRLIFSFLVEATTLALLIGLFPPLRAMLVGAVILGVILVLYVGLLVHLRTQERHVALVRARQAASRARFEAEMGRLQRVPVEALQRAARPNGNGNGHSNGNGHANGNGHHRATGRVLSRDEDELTAAGLLIEEDDVHVIVRRSSDLDADVLDSLAR
jgi:hypothetical protein